MYFKQKEDDVEKLAETQTSIRLASHLVRAPNSSSGGHEFESPMWIKLFALAEGGYTPLGQFFQQWVAKLKTNGLLSWYRAFFYSSTLGSNPEILK